MSTPSVTLIWKGSEPAKPAVGVYRRTRSFPTLETKLSEPLLGDDVAAWEVIGPSAVIVKSFGVTPRVS